MMIKFKKTTGLSTIVILLLMVLSSCRTTMPIGQSTGKADVGYIVVVSEKDNVNKDIDVSIDNGNIFFKAKAVKKSKSYSNGTAYQLSTGKKNIVITRNGKCLYRGTVMLYPQETKIISIP